MDATELLDAYAGTPVDVPTKYPDLVRILVLPSEAAPKMLAALRRVLERHRDDGDGYCFECVDASLSMGAGPVAYPCATVLAITEALEAR
jgi:hypothetical protein